MALLCSQTLGITSSNIDPNTLHLTKEKNDTFHSNVYESKQDILLYGARIDNLGRHKIPDSVKLKFQINTAQAVLNTY